MKQKLTRLLNYALNTYLHAIHPAYFTFHTKYSTCHRSTWENFL